MQRDRNADIKRRQIENRELEEQTRRMQVELDNLRKFKQQQLNKQLAALQLANQQQEKKEEEGPVKKKKEETSKLRNYGNKVAGLKPGQPKPKIKLAELEQSSSEGEEESDGENLKYFLSVVGMPHYYDKYAGGKVTGLPQLRNLKEAQLKSMGVPLKDHIKIIKKLRQMGF